MTWAGPGRWLQSNLKIGSDFQPSPARSHILSSARDVDIYCFLSRAHYIQRALLARCARWPECADVFHGPPRFKFYLVYAHFVYFDFSLH